MIWDAESESGLRALWTQASPVLSCSEIGKQLGQRLGGAPLTKCVVIGKAHRMALPARASPILRDRVPKRPRRTRTALTGQRVTLPALKAADGPIAPLSEPRVALGHLRHSCSWPLGDPGTKTFRFCSEEAAFAKPYCCEHQAIAYRPAAKVA